MNELALFAGSGGGILAGKLLGWRTICAVEIEPYPTSVLIARQNEGLLAPFPIWDDVCTFDGSPWNGIADVVSGGFPCQDISVAGKGKGISGNRSGLWKQFKRIIHEAGPPFIWAENSDLLTKRGLGTVLRDLAEVGYDAEWGVLGGSDCGAWHRRKRIWILGANYRNERIQRVFEETLPKKFGIPWGRNVRGIEDFRNRSDIYSPQLCRGGNGMADYVDRIKSIGNGQIPIVAAIAFRELRKRMFGK